MSTPAQRDTADEKFIRRTLPGRADRRRKNMRAAKELLHLVLLLHAGFWIYSLFYSFGWATSPPARDWFLLREVARSFVAGDWASLYVDRELSSGMHFFRYPPFVLYLIAPLALVPPMAAYALVCGTQLVAAISTLRLLFRVRKPKSPDLIFAGVLGSAAMAHVMVSGQNSALLALVIAAASVFWALGRNVLAGACIGLLACKPNWLPVFGLFVLWRGGLRAGAASALVAAALVLSTLPLGLGPWQGFFALTTRAGEIGVAYDAYREITLLSTLKSILGWGALTKTVWVGGLSVLAALAILALRDARPIGRSIALITLLAVIANPYASFYDGFVLVVPATLWFAHRDAYANRAWWVIGGWIGAYWIWDMAVFYYRPLVPGVGEPGLAAAGLLLTGWLVSEALARVPVLTIPPGQPNRLNQREGASGWGEHIAGDGGGTGIDKRRNGGNGKDKINYLLRSRRWLRCSLFDPGDL